MARRPSEASDFEPWDSASSVLGAESLRPKFPAKPTDEERMSLFWRVFGGTILSIVALVAITLYNNLNGGISDLRQELSREREARAGLVKKDDADTRAKSQWDRIRLVEGYKAEIEAIKERTAATAVAIEGVKKDAAAGVEAVKRETTGLEVLKERIALLETLRKELAGHPNSFVEADIKAVPEDAELPGGEAAGAKPADAKNPAPPPQPK